MGELFEVPRPKTSLLWSGERLTTATSGQVEVEHYHRYLFARQLVRGLDVLDIASGEGYGGALMSQTARSVVGVEIAPEAVAHARESYLAPNLRFEVGSAQNIPLPDACVDCVVSFETLEHFYEQAQFIDEIRRVLRPGGFLLMSSPNRDIYSPAGSPPNPHHVRELDRDELVALVSARFTNTALLAQRPIVGSVLVRPDGEGQGEPLAFDRRTAERIEASVGAARTQYWLILASAGPLPPAPSSYYFERTSLDDALVELPRLRERVGQLETERIRLEGALHAAEAERHALQAKLERKRDRGRRRLFSWFR